MRKYIYIIAFAGVFLISCNNSTGVKKPFDGLLIDHLNNQINEAAIQDGFSPPVASRIYAYCNIAAYEAYFLNDSMKKDLSMILNSYLPLSEDLGSDKYNKELGTYVAFCEVALHKVYSGYFIDSMYSKGLSYYKKMLSRTSYDHSVSTGKIIAKHIIEYSNGDLYNETRSYPLWDLSNKPSAWKPTAPTYGTAIEPHWGKLRTFFVISEDDTLTLPPPPPFDSVKGSEFYKLNMEVYNIVNNISIEDEETALHWDGDPAPPQRVKRLIILKRQLNPVGHWLAMSSILNHKTGKNEGESIYTYMKVSVACADAMIACWRYKYFYDLIRPLTYINLYIDKLWTPVLSTPLFPEYPSGHSSIAGACSAVMIDLFSDSIPYTDNSKVKFGMKERHFKNISEAAAECAMSRIYGGVHYLPAIVEGVKFGNKLGDIVNRKFSEEPYFGGKKL